MVRPVLRNHFRRDGLPKVAYEDYASACEAAELINGDGPRKIHAYECDFCPNWHIGQKRGGTKRKKSKR